MQLARPLPYAPFMHDSAAPRILVVDDDRSLLLMLEERLKAQGYEVLSAHNGDQAFHLIEREGAQLDAVMLDREMPGLKGLEVVRMMKSVKALSRIPVIMQTAADRPEQIREGIEADVFYYLTKPLQPAVMHSVLSAAITESQRQRALLRDMQHYNKSFELSQTMQFSLRTLDDAYHLAPFISQCFPEPDRVLVGISELLVNAIEHGNLEISYDEKTVLVDKNSWQQEIEFRLMSPAFQARRVDVVFKRKEQAHMIQITDEGDGFNWRSYLEIDPSRATDNHGRGIAQANHLAFDLLKFNDKGNQVVGIILNHPVANTSLEW